MILITLFLLMRFNFFLNTFGNAICTVHHVFKQFDDFAFCIFTFYFFKKRRHILHICNMTFHILLAIAVDKKLLNEKTLKHIKNSFSVFKHIYITIIFYLYVIFLCWLLSFTLITKNFFFNGFVFMRFIAIFAL